MTTAFPLAWPEGWPRSASRKRATFGKTEQRSNGHGSWTAKKALSIEEAIRRVRGELQRLGVDAANDAIVSTNLKLNLAGFPRGDRGDPADPGAAVYWQDGKGQMRVMAIDVYTRVADNLAAIAATLEAMRAIDRHGGAQILDRAFSGFAALPPPRSCWDVLGIEPGSPESAIRAAWRAKAARVHPDHGGSDAAMAEVNRARDEALGMCGR